MADIVPFPGSEGAALVVDAVDKLLVLSVVNRPPIPALPRTFGAIDKAICAAVEYGLQFELGFTVTNAALECDIARRIGPRP